MIVWRGLGFLAVLIPMAVLLIFSSLGIDKNFSYSDGLIMLISAIIIWFVGRKLNTRPAKILIDPQTNQEVVFKDKHTIFWIPMEYSAIFWAIAAIAFFMKDI